MGLRVAIIKRKKCLGWIICHLSRIFAICSFLCFSLAIGINLYSGDIWYLNPFRPTGIKSILNQINQHRKEVGLKSLQEDPNLCHFANERLDEIIKNGFSHRGFKPLLNKKLVWHFNSTGENLARDLRRNEITGAWLNSRKHREIIETKNYDYGCVESKNNIFIFVAGEKEIKQQ